MKRIQVLTIDQEEEDFSYLFGLWNNVRILGQDLILSFEQCTFLRQNAVAFIGGIVDYVAYMGHRAVVDWSSFRPAVLKNLERNGFCAYLGMETKSQVGNAVPFRRNDSVADSDSIIKYLSRDWLGRGWMTVSADLATKVTRRVWELYANAFEDSGSPIGVYSCGQYYPRLRQLALSIVDFGKGVPANVRGYLCAPRLPASQALSWAFARGTTTNPVGTGRGLGLDLIREYLAEHMGHLEMYSNEGRAVLRFCRSQPPFMSFTNRSVGFQGTVVNIMIRCDEKYYALASESRSQRPPSVV